MPSPFSCQSLLILLHCVFEFSFTRKFHVRLIKLFLTSIDQKIFLFVYSEHLIKQMADRLAEDGYRDAGYEYVSIDVSDRLSRNLTPSLPWFESKFS